MSLSDNSFIEDLLEPHLLHSNHLISNFNKLCQTVFTCQSETTQPNQNTVDKKRLNKTDKTVIQTLHTVKELIQLSSSKPQLNYFKFCNFGYIVYSDLHYTLNVICIHLELQFVFNRTHAFPRSK